MCFTLMRTCCVAAILLALGISAGADLKDVPPPVEIRAIWVDAGAIPKTPDGVRRLVRAYHDANINILFPEVVCRGYAVYESGLLRRDPRFDGVPDPLPIMIREAHKLGMEVHPWVWVFRAGYTKDRGAILSDNPEWTELAKDGSDLSPNGGLWVSPSLQPARDFLAELFAELVTKYPVDGLHTDYIRYESESSAPYGYSPTSRSLFRSQYGMEPAEIEPFSIETYEWTKFRERQVNTFVQRIALQTRRLNPRAMLSAAVGPNPKTARLDLMQNWVNWLENGWLDFVVPMAYSTSDSHFQKTLEEQLGEVNVKGLVAPGIGLHLQNEPSQTLSQIGLTRKRGFAGQALFAASYFGSEHAAAVREQAYTTGARLPFRDTEAAITLLRSRADALVEDGNAALADACQQRADTLAGYLEKRSRQARYVPPAHLPMTIYSSIVPLPEATVHRTLSAPIIDGDLRDPTWQQASRIELAYNTVGEVTSTQTTAQLAYDDSNIYIAFRCVEPEMERIRKQAKLHDEYAFQDDSIEVFLRPSLTAKDYYHFAVNSVGATYDARGYDAKWNGAWHAASKTEPGGWTAEIAIPFASLRAARPTENLTWAANVSRNRTTSGELETTVWAVPYGSLHNLERFGRVTFTCENR